MSAGGLREAARHPRTRFSLALICLLRCLFFPIHLSACQSSLLYPILRCLFSHSPLCLPEFSTLPNSQMPFFPLTSLLARVLYSTQFSDAFFPHSPLCLPEFATLPKMNVWVRVCFPHIVSLCFFFLLPQTSSCSSFIHIYLSFLL